MIEQLHFNRLMKGFLLNISCLRKVGRFGGIFWGQALNTRDFDILLLLKVTGWIAQNLWITASASTAVMLLLLISEKVPDSLGQRFKILVRMSQSKSKWALCVKCSILAKAYIVLFGAFLSSADFWQLLITRRVFEQSQRNLAKL